MALTVKPGESVFDIVRFERVTATNSWREKWRTSTLRVATAMTVDEATDRVVVASASGDVATFYASTGSRTLLYTNTISARITAISVNGPFLGLADSVGRVWVRSSTDESIEFFWQAHQGATTTLVGTPARGAEAPRFASGGTDGAIAIRSITPAYRFTTRTDLPDLVTSVRVDRDANQIWVGTPTGV